VAYTGQVHIGAGGYHRERILATAIESSYDVVSPDAHVEGWTFFAFARKLGRPHLVQVSVQLVGSKSLRLGGLR